MNGSREAIATLYGAIHNTAADTKWAKTDMPLRKTIQLIAISVIVGFLGFYGAFLIPGKGSQLAYLFLILYSMNLWFLGEAKHVLYSY
jgi:hypothetical protein